MPAGDAKAVKKEEIEDGEDRKSLNSFAKNKKQKPVNGSAEASRKATKVKKEEPKDEDYDELPTKKNLKKVDKDKKKKKKKKKEEKGKQAVKVEVSVKKKEKKVYHLPGQKRDPPEERDPLRIFYETLHKQLPGSEIAAFWMMESGLLPMEAAKKVYEKKLKKNQQQKLRSPIKKITKSVTVKRTLSKKKTLASPTSSAKKKIVETKTVLKKQSKKRKTMDSSSDNDSDEEFVLSKKKIKKQ